MNKNLNSQFLQVKSLLTKFDLAAVSNSFVRAIGSYLEARILQQFIWFNSSGYGVVLDGVRWIYKAMREMISELFVGFTNWQVRKAIASLIERKLLIREQLFKKHHGDNYAPKNRTYYYRVNREELEKLLEKAESTGNDRFVGDTKQFCESSEKQFCGVSQNRTENTSIENNQRTYPPYPPSEGEEKKGSNQEKEFDSSNRSEVKEEQSFSSSSKPVLKEAKEAGCSTNDVKTRTKAPWANHQEFAAFRKALIPALAIVANARSPRGLANKILKELEQGLQHDYWDEWKAGLPIGTSDQQEWQIEPGVPYPMFIEYLTEKIKRGNNTQTNEQARNEVFRILDQPRQAKAFWGQFKRSVVNVADQVERDRALGVSNPSTPVWTRERVEPTIEEAVEAGEKIMAVNGASQGVLEAASNPHLESSDPKTTTPDPWKEEDKPKTSLKEMLAVRGVKGFCQTMPKVSRAEAEAEAKAESEVIARSQMNCKTNINQMSLEQINELIKDPIMKAELMPQLFVSDYELVTDYLGQIIRVELSEVQIREKRRLEKEQE